jgi:hypothetical protein
VAKSDIEKDPEVKKLLDTKRDELMVNLMYEDLINKHTFVTVDKMQEFYELNKERYRQPEHGVSVSLWRATRTPPCARRKRCSPDIP